MGIKVIVALVLGLVGVGAAPGVVGAAEPVLDLEIVSAPTSPAAVGDLVEVVFRPTIESDDPIHELENVTVSFDLPANLAVHSTYSQGEQGNDRSCLQSGATWTCTDWAANFGTWKVTLVAVAPVAGLDLVLNATSAAPDVPAATASTPIDITPGVADAGVSATVVGGAAVGDPMALWVALENSGDRLVVGATVTVDLDGEVVVDPEVGLTPAYSDPLFGAGWTSGTCTATGTTITCTDVNLYPSWWGDGMLETVRFLEVRAVPLAAGSLALGATITPGPAQTEPQPDPTSNSWGATHPVAEATDGTVVALVDGTDGLPVGGTTVAAFAPTDTTTPSASGTTDAAGQVVLTGLPSDGYTLRLDAPGYATQWHRDDGTASSRATAGTVAVPTTGATVHVDARLEDLDTSRVDLGGGAFGEPDVAVVGEEESLRIRPGSRRWRVDGTLSVAATDTTFTVTTSPSLDILDALQTRGPGGGDPVGACEVEAHLATCSLPDTDIDVVVDVVATAPGPAVVTMAHTSALTEAVPDGLPTAAEQTIDAVASIATLTGVVVGPNGVPVEGASVWAYLPDDGFVPADPDARGITGADGRFTLDQISPGTYDVLIRPAGDVLAPTWLPDAATRDTATPIGLWLGQVVDVGTVELAEVGTISGTVTDAAGPVAGATVAAFADGTAWLPIATATSEPDGTYVLDDLPAGGYQVRITSASGATTWYGGTAHRAEATTVSVGPGATVTGVDISPVTTTTVSGTVTGPDGPVEGAVVWLYGPHDTWLGSRWADTGTDGSYTVTAVPSGTYLVRVVPPGGSASAPRWYDAPVRSAATPVVVAGSPITGIDVTLG